MLIFDEVTSNIDKERRKKFFEILHSLSEKNITIMITHNEAELVNADVIYELSDEGVREVKYANRCN